MRTYPIDGTRVHMISTGTCKPSPLIEKDRDGKWGVVEGKQAVDQATRLPLWTVEVIIPGDEGDDRDRTGVVELEIAAKDRPDPGTFGEILQFEGLAMTPGYLKKATGQVTPPRWSASGIRRQAQPKAA